MADPALAHPPTSLTKYCVCQQIASDVMIECIRATGGCNGWVHPKCCGLVLSQEELNAMDDFICPLCEDPSDDYAKLNATNASRANKSVNRARRRSSRALPVREDDAASRSGPIEKGSKRARRDTGSSGRLSAEEKPQRKNKWTCKVCTLENLPMATECAECFEPRNASKKRKTKHRLKRRSGRDKRTKSYHVPASDEEGDTDDMSIEEMSKLKKTKKKKIALSDDDDEEESTQPQAQYEMVALVIEKILGTRKAEVNEQYTGQSRHSSKQYYIKWKGLSFMHSSWEDEETLLNLDPQGNKQKIRRFEDKQIHRQVFTGADEEEYFNPEYLEVDRIIAEREEPPIPNELIHGEDSKEEPVVDDGVRYLVKWRSLPYCDCTWERACDISDDVAIKRFKRQNIVPPEDEWHPLPHPHIRDYKKLDESPGYGDDKELKLRGYQLEGLNWLVWNWYNRRSCILADEMGLGKTIQTLTFLDHLRSSPKIKCRGPFLIIAPLSLITQWQNETDTWTVMDCVVYHGNHESREILRQNEFHFFVENNKPDKRKPIKFNILVTTFEVAMKDVKLLQKIHWRCLVVDEAHRLKNHQSRLVEQLRGIRRDHCILLTGTPLQNKTEELWALLHFLAPKNFPRLNEFLEKFGNLQDSKQVAELHQLLKPYLLRRVKEDVEKSLPPKEETIVEVELTAVQKQWYRAIYERNTAFLHKGCSPANAPNLMNVMMELRKCCNHPYLNNGVENVVSEGLTTEAERHEMMVKCCGKMVLLDKLLPRLKSEGHKVLIFSQMVRVLDILEDYIRYVGHAYERLDGNIRGNLRQSAVDRFVKPEYKRFIMLLSTKAGGLGLNLTAADTVIIFDSDWNPQNDLQAQARAHRIGQTHSVKIYRLITRKTYEMHMFHRASLKLGLDRAVLTHMRQENENSGKKKLSKAKEEAVKIDELLKKGAYDVFRDDDTEAEQFCAADIDQILQRSTQVVQYEQQARSQFSKASFVSATSNDDVDIDDPDFWKKAVGLSEPEPALEDGLLIPAMRKRTRVARFGALDDGDSDDEFETSTVEDKEDAEARQEKREWTINGRERLQRALMHFGFGRWDVIRNQSGGSRDIKEVENFARAFVLHCGLCSAENPSGKDDSPFVKGAIRAAQAVEAQYFGSGETLPPVLVDPDFVTKLKSGGARRVLVRLDMLLRLQRMISAACDRVAEQLRNEPQEKCDQEESTSEVETVKANQHPDSDKKEEKVDATTDTEQENQKPESQNAEEIASAKLEQNPFASAETVDDRIRRLGVERVADNIEILDVGERPSWSKLTPWWDLQGDRHILMGVFLHGYGRHGQIMSDARLCFFKRSQAANEQAAEGEVDAVNGSPEKSENGTLSEAKDQLDRASVQSGEIPDNRSVDEETVASTVCDSEAVKPASTKKFPLPEVQQINRLLFWLLSAEDLKRQKDEERSRRDKIQAEHKRQVDLEKKQRKAAMKRAVVKCVQMIQMDMLRHGAYLYNLRVSRGLEPLRSMKQWSKEECRSLCYMIAALGIPQSFKPESKSLTEGAEIQDPPQTELYWEDFVYLAQLHKSPQRVANFVKEKFLPKCKKVSHLKIDPLGASSKLSFSGFDYVDVFESAHSHGLKAKRLAILCLRRMKLFKVVRWVMQNKFNELKQYLESEQGAENLNTMPKWWCPWIHDIGLFQGMLRHGVFAWKSIRADPSSPFHQSVLDEHIQAVFLKGNAEEDFRPVLGDAMETPSEMWKWYKTIVAKFPSAAKLERRVQCICAHLTKDLDAEDPHRIEIPQHLEIPDTIAIDSALISVDKPFGEEEPGNRMEEIKSLEDFVAQTADRRMAYLKDPGAAVSVPPTQVAPEASSEAKDTDGPVPMELETTEPTVKIEPVAT